MESISSAEDQPGVADYGREIREQMDIESSDNFQKFIYELFDKNGILNDLRAYLRTHIVGILKSARTGEPPMCQKQFAQRLDLNMQAFNVLIAEYLLSLDYNYTFSVFVSEIPLANMVFDFTKTLLTNPPIENLSIRFTDHDVWAILNYLGLKCDSVHANSMLKMYKADKKTPLLACILKCTPLYDFRLASKPTVESDSSVYSTPKNSDMIKEKIPEPIDKSTFRVTRRTVVSDKCRHYAYCRSCQGRMTRLKDKCRKAVTKEKDMLNKTPAQNLSVKKFMRNINTMERNLINEMFDQLKNVYETELDMVKKEEESKVKRSLANHAALLEKQRDELEQAFKKREEELLQNVQHKKKFLWGLARALRDQHDKMARAMHAVKYETRRLTEKEDDIKSQLIEAEEVLKKRSEDMQKQISSELFVLETHLDTLKRDRNVIQQTNNKQILFIEEFKTPCQDKTNNQTHEELKVQYDLLKEELVVLRKYLASTKERMHVAEKGVMTDGEFTKHSALNNELDADIKYTRDESRRFRSPNRVVNDFKKPKNVNFVQIDTTYTAVSSPQSSAAGSYAGKSDAAPQPDAPDLLQRLRVENDTLKSLARQQSCRIEQLCRQSMQPPPHAPHAARPRTAPAALPLLNTYNGKSVAEGGSVRGGAGEEAWAARGRELAPTDHVPFIGVMHDTRADQRRHLINQWRMLRRRFSPHTAINKLRGWSPPKHSPERKVSGDRVSKGLATEPHLVLEDKAKDTPLSLDTEAFKPRKSQRGIKLPSKGSFMDESPVCRDKSPKSVLREAKEKLRNAVSREGACAPTREKSPSCVLREAKLRLRKLEIEAEAVEKSYMDFRKRQTARKEELTDKNAIVKNPVLEENVVTRDKEPFVAPVVEQSKSRHNVDQNKPNIWEHGNLDLDFDKYFRDYTTNDLFERSRKAQAPIPEAINVTVERVENLLNTPLTEFRKLYTSKTNVEKCDSEQANTKTDEIGDENEENSGDLQKQIQKDFKDIKDAFIKEKNEKKAELEILRQNITKMYNLTELPLVETPVAGTPLNEALDQRSLSGSTEYERVQASSVDFSNKDMFIKDNESNRSVFLVVRDTDDDCQQISTNMTILISPKRSIPEVGNAVVYERSPSQTPTSRRSVSPEQAARLTRNDVLDAIFHADHLNEMSSMALAPLAAVSVEDTSISDVEKEAVFYQDDLSIEADNYNSHSECRDRNSPISKLDDDDQTDFWDN